MHQSPLYIKYKTYFFIKVFLYNVIRGYNRLNYHCVLSNPSHILKLSSVQYCTFNVYFLHVRTLCNEKLE